MTKLILIFILAMTLNPLAFADGEGGGYGAGNGGTGVICTNLKTGKETLQLLDLWEHSRTDVPGLQLNIPMKPDAAEAQVMTALNRFIDDKRYDDEAKAVQNLKTELFDEVSHVFERINDPESYLKPGHVIEFPWERLPSTRPENCRYAPIVSYQLDGTLVIDPTLLARLRETPTQLAALVVHEALYRLARDLFSINDSTPVRELVALLFSETTDADSDERKGDLRQRVGKSRANFTERNGHGTPTVLRLNHHRQSKPYFAGFDVYLRTDHARRNDCVLDLKVLNQYGHALHSGIHFDDNEAMDTTRSNEGRSLIDFSQVSRRSSCGYFDSEARSRRCHKGLIRNKMYVSATEIDGAYDALKSGKYRLSAKLTCDSPTEMVIRVPREKIVLFGQTLWNDNESLTLKSNTDPTLIQLK